MTPLLFISHEASRTGAPILLLHYLRWLRQTARYDFEVLVLRSDEHRGELLADFRALGPTHVLDHPRRLACLRLPGRLQARLVASRLRGRRFALVYANTVLSGGAALAMARGRCPCVWHIHEMEYVISRSVPASTFRATHAHVARLIAVSLAVQRDLVDRFGVPPSKIDLIHEFIPAPLPLEGHAACAPDVRRALGIPQEALLVGASGTLDWRKGADLLVPLALLVSRRLPEHQVHFLWIGAREGTTEYAQLRHDARRAGVDQQLHFVPACSNPLPYFGIIDAFALLSREDPFPLVVLEAGAMEKPVVCFSGAGGADELVAQGCGLSAPYLDLPAFADALAFFLEDDLRRIKVGVSLRELIAARHSVDVAAPRITQVIDRLLAASTDPPIG